jgi:hypothetical protein
LGDKSSDWAKGSEFDAYFVGSQNSQTFSKISMGAARETCRDMSHAGSMRRPVSSVCHPAKLASGY